MSYYFLVFVLKRFFFIKGFLLEHEVHNDPEYKLCVYDVVNADSPVLYLAFCLFMNLASSLCQMYYYEKSQCANVGFMESNQLETFSGDCFVHCVSL